MTASTIFRDILDAWIPKYELTYAGLC